jgi:ELMO/CED-12 family
MSEGGEADCVLCCVCASVVHERVLVSIYRGLLGSSECPPVFGSHWEAIGFQGSDPATDVRGGGVFGLLLISHFIQSQPGTARRLFQLANDDMQVTTLTHTGCRHADWMLC